MANSSESKPLLLLTGATGFIGYNVLVYALASGYAVRAAVRDPSAAEAKLFKTPAFANNPAYKSLTTFVSVPDILAPGAYTEAIKGVSYVIHCASPLIHPSITDFEAGYIQPAMQGTLNMLRAAAIESSVKRIVVTSSVAANKALGATTTTNAHSRLPTPTPPFDDFSPFQAYAASKTAALNAAEEWHAQHANEVSFDVVHLMPGFVLGRNDLATSRAELESGTAAMALIHLVDAGGPRAGPRPGQAVHIADVAELHVAALDKRRIEGSRAYGVTRPVVWEEAFQIVKRRFPEAVEEGVFVDGEYTTLESGWDASETEAVFGLKFRGFEECVVDSAGQWVEVLGAEKEKA